MSAIPVSSRRNPLTAEDWKYLEDVTGKRGAKNQFAMMFAAVAFICMAGVKIWLAFWLARHDGYTVQTFLARFSGGALFEETYSGTFIRAADNMTYGILLLAMAVVQTVTWWRGRAHRERSRRILNALKDAEARL